jgi:hypothetical protein
MLSSRKNPCIFYFAEQNTVWEKILKKPSAGRLSADFQQVKKKNNKPPSIFILKQV